MGLLIPVTLSLFVIISESNKILSHFSTVEFRNRQQARALAQIRAQMAMSTYYCMASIDSHLSPSADLAEKNKDLCFANLEGAMAQLNRDLVSNSNGQLRERLDQIYNKIEKATDRLSTKDRIQIVDEMNAVVDETGTDESIIWGEQTAEYGHLLSHFKSYYRTFYLLVANIAAIAILLITINYIKLRKEKRLEIIEKEVEANRIQMIHHEKMSALGEMAAGIAHEINNPLTVIKSKAIVIKRDVESGNPDPEKIFKEVERITSMSDRVAKIIRGLRNFARDGAADPFEVCNVVDLVQDVLEITSARMQDHGIELRVNTGAKAIIAQIRPTQILQVMVNLLNNAHDAIEKNELKWVELSLHDGPENIEIWVTDSGNGISREIQEKIFQPFFTTKEVGKGTGLGLGITVGIIKSHQGTIFVDNTCPNTRFKVVLPKKQVPSKAVAA